MELNVLNDFIVHARGLIGKELCRDIVSAFENDPAKRPGLAVDYLGEKKLDPSKVSVELEMKHESAPWKKLHEPLHLEVAYAIQSIVSQVPALQVKPVQWSGYKIKKYNKGEGHFKWHFDALGPGMWNRQLAIIVYLNDVAVGGETSFQRQNLKIKPVAGDAVFFPPFWTHLHAGEIPVSNDKYVITSFLEFKIPGK